MDYGTYQFQNLIELLGSPLGLVLLMSGAATAIGVFVVRPAKWAVLVLLLFVANMAAYNLTTQRPLITPFDQMRTYGRSLAGAFLALLLLPALVAPRGYRQRIASAGAVALLVFQLILTVRLALAGDDVRWLGLVLFPLTFVVLHVGAGKWVQTSADLHTLIAAVAMGGLIMAGGTAMQVAADASAVAHQGRLFGLTGNANHVGALFAMTLVPTCYLIARPGARTWARLWWGAAAGLAAVFVLWTGSRTSALMATVGLAVLFRAKLGRLLLTAVLAGTGVLVFLSFYEQGADMAERLLWTKNTRAAGWAAMWATFLANPLIGAPADPGASESSFLFVAALAGLVGLVPLFVALGLIARDLLGVFQSRRELGSDAFAADLVMACFVMVIAGAFFEGYLAGFISFPVYFLYLLLTIGSYLRDRIDAVRVPAVGLASGGNGYDDGMGGGPYEGLAHPAPGGRT